MGRGTEEFLDEVADLSYEDARKYAENTAERLTTLLYFRAFGGGEKEAYEEILREGESLAALSAEELKERTGADYGLRKELKEAYEDEIFVNDEGLIPADTETYEELLLSINEVRSNSLHPLVENAISIFPSINFGSRLASTLEQELQTLEEDEIREICNSINQKEGNPKTDHYLAKKPYGFERRRGTDVGSREDSEMIVEDLLAPELEQLLEEGKDETTTSVEEESEGVEIEVESEEIVDEDDGEVQLIETKEALVPQTYD